MQQKLPRALAGAPLWLALALAPVSLWAQPSVGNTGVKIVPRDGMITESGHYILNRTLNLGVNAVEPGVTITANDVTLDLNGFGVVGPGQMIGIGVLIEGARGVTLRNGKVADFHFNVVVRGSRNVILEDLEIRGRGLLPPAPPPETGIMIAQSANVVVRDNAIYNTGLGIFVRGGESRGNRIEGNTITAESGILAICYNPTPEDPRGPRGDWIVGNLMTGYNLGLQMSDLSMYNIIQGNTIAYLMGGGAFNINNDTNQTIDNTTVPLP